MTENGWEHEGAPEHILRLLDIFGMQDAKIVTSPGIKEQVLESDETPLNKEDHSLYRTGVGILLYAASDRSDLKYAVKELMRDVSAPTELSTRRLCRRFPLRRRRAKSCEHHQLADDRHRREGHRRCRSCRLHHLKEIDIRRLDPREQGIYINIRLLRDAVYGGVVVGSSQSSLRWSQESLSCFMSRTS